MKNKKKLFLSLLAFGALVITGCNGGSKDSSSSGSSSDPSSSQSSSSTSSSEAPQGDMSITAEKTSIVIGETLQLTCSQKTGVTWRSSDSDIATVTLNGGLVEGLAEGKVTITASKVLYKNATLEITVTGQPPVVHDDYILYGKIGSDTKWTEHKMTQSTEPGKSNEYYIKDVQVNAGDNFVFHYNGDIWYKYDDIDAISVGMTSQGTDSNIEMNYDGWYDFYIGFDIAGKHVSIVKHHDKYEYDYLGLGNKEKLRYEFQTSSHPDQWVIDPVELEADAFFDVYYNDLSVEIDIDPECSGYNKVHIDSTNKNRLVIDYDGTYSCVVKNYKLYVEYSEQPVGTPDYVMHLNRVGTTDWVDVNMSADPDLAGQYVLLNYAMTAGDVFVFHYSGETWYKYDNLMPESKALVGNDGEGNMTMNTTGVYNFYIGFGQPDEPHVSIVDASPQPDPTANYVMHAKLNGSEEWTDTPLVQSTEVGKENEYILDKASLKANDVLCFHYTGNTWYKYADVDGISIGMVSEDEDGNIVINYDGTYTFYIGFTNDQNKHVSIVKAHDNYQYSIDGGVNKSSMTFQFETESHPDQWVVAEGEIPATTVLSIYKNDAACDVVLTDDCTGKDHVTVLNNTITINDAGNYSFLVSGGKLNLSYKDTPVSTPNYVMHLNKNGTTTWTDVVMTQSTEPGKAEEYVLTGYELNAGDVIIFHYVDETWYGYSDIQNECLGQVDPVENTNDIKIKEDGKYDFYVGRDVDGKHIYLAKQTVQVPNHTIYGKINGGTTWEATELTHSSDTTKPNEYLALNIEMKAGDTFVFHYEGNIWYNFDDCDALSLAVVEKAGGESTDIVMKADGFYDIYIGFTNLEGKHVSIIPHVEKAQYAVSIPDAKEPTKIDLAYDEAKDTYKGLIANAKDNDVVTFYTKTSDGYLVFTDNIELEEDGYVAGYKNNIARTKNPTTGEYTNVFYIIKGSEELEISLRIDGDKKVIWVSGGEEIVTVPDHSLYGKINGGTTWEIVSMTQSTEEGKEYQYEIHNIDLKAGDVFVFRYEGDVWYHYTDCDDTARQYVEAGSDDNIVVTTYGNYNIYIGFTSGEGKHVSITKNKVEYKHYVYINTEQILEMTKNSSGEYVLENIALEAGDELSFTEGTEVLQVTPKEDLNENVNNVRVGTPSYYLVVIKALSATEGQGIYLDPTTNKVWVSGNTVSYSIGKKGSETSVEFGAPTDKGTYKEYAATLTNVVAGDEYVINKSIHAINVVAEDNAENNAVSTADSIRIRQSAASLTVYLKVYPDTTDTYGCWVTGYSLANAVYQMYDANSSSYIAMQKTEDAPGFKAQYKLTKDLEAMTPLSFAVDYKSIGIYKDAADTNNICEKEGKLFVHNYAANADIYLKVPDSGNSCVYISGRKAFSEYALQYTITNVTPVDMSYSAATGPDPEQWKATKVVINAKTEVSLGSNGGHNIPLTIENTTEQVSGCIDINQSNSQGIIVVTAPCTLDIYAKDNDGTLLVWLTVTPAN